MAVLERADRRAALPRPAFGERAMVTAMRAPVGDYRDWAGIAAWAGEVAAAISAGVPAGRV